MAQKFLSTECPENPCFVAEYIDHLLTDVIPYCVRTGSPSFIGHMTSALPYFQLSLTKCMAALHQNVVKIETSRALTFLERQVMGMLHRIFYANSESFYIDHTQNRRSTLGLICSGGTIANISALWVARNTFIKKHTQHPNNSLLEALLNSNHKGMAIYVSVRGHYSLSKAADLLGLGKSALVRIPVDSDHRINTQALTKKIAENREQGIAPLAIVGIAGSTETGSVDPLQELADIAEREKIHFHVDAAWGGPVIFSQKHSPCLNGITRADSITVDGHKQFYLPLGIGMVLFKNPDAARHIEQQANYIIREGSFDLGKRSLEGSRPGMVLLLEASLRVLGKKGFELLIDKNIERCREFTFILEESRCFEVISQPQLNIVTYRFNPMTPSDAIMHRHELNLLNLQIQKTQRERGQSFVSRTNFSHPEPDGPPVTVLRAVLANPLTKRPHLEEFLNEQQLIAEELVLQYPREFPGLSSSIQQWKKP